MYTSFENDHVGVHILNQLFVIRRLCYVIWVIMSTWLPNRFNLVICLTDVNKVYVYMTA